ncbi:MAG: hypothetical protein J2P35_06815 [Actinobacteria bacterium]|nr:hypothetical protein [Actinomycetota bacterium]MBO0784806.1 hypothetical protein [Actinomycetota bacterium]
MAPIEEDEMHPYISRALAAEMIRDRYAEAAQARRAQQARRHADAGEQNGRHWHVFPLRRDPRPATAAAGSQDHGLAA